MMTPGHRCADADRPEAMGGMGGMGGMGLSLEQAQASGVAMLNQAAASDQAEEMRVADEPSPGIVRRSRRTAPASASRSPDRSTSPRAGTRSCSRSPGSSCRPSITPRPCPC